MYTLTHPLSVIEKKEEEGEKNAQSYIDTLGSKRNGEKKMLRY